MRVTQISKIYPFSIATKYSILSLGVFSFTFHRVIQSAFIYILSVEREFLWSLHRPAETRAKNSISTLLLPSFP